MGLAAASADHSCTDCSGLKAKTASLMNENMRLHAELRAAQETLSMHRSEAQRRLERRCFDERARGLDENSKLLNLHVASLRLHEGNARQEVILAIQEIVINLIGCEEFGVFEMSPDGVHLSLVSSLGIQPERFASILIGDGVIGQVAASGEAHVASPASGVRQTRQPGQTAQTGLLTGQPQPQPSAQPGGAEEGDLSACVPLRLCGRVVGVLAMFRLLEHKPYLGELDRELLDLVSMQAAPALYCAQLMAR